MGQFKNYDEQVGYQVCKVQVIVPRENSDNQLPDETSFRGRFYLTILGKNLKIIDTERLRVFDLLTEPNFSNSYDCTLGLTRSLNDLRSKLFILCNSNDNKSSYV